MPSSVPIYPLRLPPELKAKAEARAAKLGISFNLYIARALDAYGEWKPQSFKMSAPPTRNSICVCGSGLKYKRCCGR